MDCQHANSQRANTTNHWAHRHRSDGCKTPVSVLGWTRGRTVEPTTLRSAFRHLQFPRTINRHGYVSVQRFFIYAERGLTKQRVSIWIYDNRLNIEHDHTLLARYRCSINRGTKSLKSVSHPQLYTSQFASPQLELFELDADQWLKVSLRPPYAPRKRQTSQANQLALFSLLVTTYLIFRL